MFSAPFIADDTIKNNIAFGITENQIDVDLVRECISITQLNDFIKNLPNDINTEW